MVDDPTESANGLYSRLRDTEERIELVERRIHKLRKQAIRAGPGVDPSVELELEDSSKELKRLKRDHKGLEAKLTKPTGRASTPSARRRLEVQHAELQRRYDVLTRRISALDTDIGRELDSERKLVLQERRADLAAERDQVATDMARIEQQLDGPSVAMTRGAPVPAATVPAAGLSAEDHASPQRQLAELHENLRLIEERKSEFVQETDIPLQLVKDERRLRERIADLEHRLGIG